MNTVKVRTFTIKNKEDGKRYLMELTGNPKTTKEFKDAFDFPEDVDFRTVRWLTEYDVVSDYTGINVEYVYDSQDNAFSEAYTE